MKVLKIKIKYPHGKNNGHFHRDVIIGEAKLILLILGCLLLCSRIIFTFTHKYRAQVPKLSRIMIGVLRDNVSPTIIPL